MTERDAALTRLVQDNVGEGKRFTTRSFSERAIDPESGYVLGKSMVNKIMNGISFKITPEIVGAIAAGLGMSKEAVAARAARQFLGVNVEVRESRSGDVRVARTSDTEGKTPLTDAWIAKQLDGDN